MVPADPVINAVLIAVALAIAKAVSLPHPFIVHSGTSEPRENPVTYGLPARVTLDNLTQNPPVRGIFKPQFKMIRSWTKFRIAWFAKSALNTAATMSGSTRLKRKPTKLKKLTSRARTVVDVFRPFTPPIGCSRPTTVRIWERLRKKYVLKEANVELNGDALLISVEQRWGSPSTPYGHTRPV